MAHWSGARWLTGVGRGGSLEWGAVAHWSGVRWLTGVGRGGPLTATGVGRGGSDWLDRATDNRVGRGFESH